MEKTKFRINKTQLKNKDCVFKPQIIKSKSRFGAFSEGMFFKMNQCTRDIIFLLEK